MKKNKRYVIKMDMRTPSGIVTHTLGIDGQFYIATNMPLVFDCVLSARIYNKHYLTRYIEHVFIQGPRNGIYSVR